MESIPYIPGNAASRKFPLQRFLPNIPDGIFHSWVEKNLKPGQWIIDPFGSSPFLPFEAVRAGCNILVICNNPVLQHYLEVLAGSPEEKDFNIALATFEKEKFQSERLETHLKALYDTICPNCHRNILAKAYIWHKEQPYPTSRMIECPYCKTEGEFKISEHDRLRLDEIGIDELHRTHVVQRLNLSPQSMEGAKTVINTYFPRPLYFLSTFINRLERIHIDAKQKKYLYAMLLHALDAGNAIWPWPSTNSRPKQINIPSVFIEYNLWNALEESIELWSNWKKTVSITTWPDLPETPGICLYKGRIAGLRSFEKVLGHRPRAAVTVFPRPNQAFWSLSAVWTGWLWGKTAAYHMKSALERKRFDWYWFSNALHQSLKDVRNTLSSEGKVFGLIPETETGFLASVLISAEYAGFTLYGSAYRPETELTQCLWQISRIEKKKQPPFSTSVCESSIKKLLLSRNEPIDRTTLYLACLESLSDQKVIPKVDSSLSYFAIKEFQQKILSILEDPEMLQGFHINIGNYEQQVFWGENLKERPEATLSDLVELSVIDLLEHEMDITQEEIDRKICQKFYGLLTPSSGIVEACLKAYTDEHPQKPGVIRLKEYLGSDSLHERKHVVGVHLRKIGTNLGFNVSNDFPIQWLKKTHEAEFSFNILLNAAIGRTIFSNTDEITPTNVIVLPDQIMGLLKYKWMINPRYHAACRHYGKIVSYSQVNEYAQNQELNLPDFLRLLDRQIILSEGPSQIPFFE